MMPSAFLQQVIFVPFPHMVSHPAYPLVGMHLGPDSTQPNAVVMQDAFLHAYLVLMVPPIPHYKALGPQAIDQDVQWQGSPGLGPPRQALAVPTMLLSPRCS